MSTLRTSRLNGPAEKLAVSCDYVVAALSCMHCKQGACICSVVCALCLDHDVQLNPHVITIVVL